MYSIAAFSNAEFERSTPKWGWTVTGFLTCESATTARSKTRQVSSHVKRDVLCQVLLLDSSRKD
ncbi:MAG TPA: hypothetical protein VFD70_13245, partial [Anaerolineae bacterium]|nr:hypothetical protein [Anaerolineae bacterium]